MLDHFYLRRQYRLNQMCGRLDVLDEFWDAPREVIMSPKRPDLSPIPQTPTAAEREANPAYWEEAFWE